MIFLDRAKKKPGETTKDFALLLISIKGEVFVPDQSICLETIKKSCAGLNTYFVFSTKFTPLLCGQMNFTYYLASIESFCYEILRLYLYTSGNVQHGEESER